MGSYRFLQGETHSRDHLYPGGGEGVMEEERGGERGRGRERERERERESSLQTKTLLMYNVKFHRLLTKFQILFNLIYM